MPDSDEEYERRNRTDRFARERDYGGGERPRMGRDFNNMDRPRRDYSNGVGLKRMGYMPLRRDEPYEPKRGRFDDAVDSFEPEFRAKGEAVTPVMLTFKKFLATQDESISNEEAIAKYKDYKLEFKRQECEKYFQAHKGEEWFRLKYHSIESVPPKEERREAVRKRLQVFTEFLEDGRIDEARLDYDNAEKIIRLMDSVVVKLEDGTDSDLEAMMKEPIEDESLTDLKKATETSEKPTNKEVPAPVPADQADAAPASNGEHAEKEIKKETDENSTSRAKRKAQPYKTSSIFFKNIPPTAKIAELENLCKERPGFLRLCLTDPMPERQFLRHGWASYRREMNINEIFWGLKNEKLEGENIGAAVNADLKRRVRSVNGVTMHKAVAQNDIRQASKLVALYDYKAGLFTKGDSSSAGGALEDLEVAIVDSSNPVLRGIVDYLVEEANAEEEQLLNGGRPFSIDGGVDMKEVKYPLEVDAALLGALDRIILYLRIVHSIDFYNYAAYANEDLMPNRLGLIHVRGQPPKGEIYGKTESGIPLISKNFLDEFISVFNSRLSSSLLKNTVLTQEELAKLGRKDPEKAVEEFMEKNCVKLGEEKWLCPLSQKKFKAPEFVHKHLQSKYAETIEEERNEVLFFNNFLADPERPQNVDMTRRAVGGTPSVQSLQSTPQSLPSNEDRRMGGGGEFSDRGGYRGGGTGTWSGSDRGAMGPGRFMGGGGGGGMRPPHVGSGGFGAGRDFTPRPRYFDGAGSGNSGDSSARRPPPVNPDRPQTSYRDLDAVDDVVF